MAVISSSIALNHNFYFFSTRISIAIFNNILGVVENCQMEITTQHAGTKNHNLYSLAKNLPLFLQLFL